MLDTAQQSRKDISECCEYLLHHLDYLQFSNYVFDDITSSGMLMKNQVIIKGKCKDYSAMSSRALRHKGDTTHRIFICMKSLMEESEAFSTPPLNYTMQVNSLSELTENDNMAASPILIRFIDSLLNRKVEVICCSILIEDKTRSILLQKGLQMVILVFCWLLVVSFHNDCMILSFSLVSYNSLRSNLDDSDRRHSPSLPKHSCSSKPLCYFWRLL